MNINEIEELLEHLRNDVLELVVDVEELKDRVKKLEGGSGHKEPPLPGAGAY